MLAVVSKLSSWVRRVGKKERRVEMKGRGVVGRRTGMLSEEERRTTELTRSRLGSWPFAPSVKAKWVRVWGGQRKGT